MHKKIFSTCLILILLNIVISFFYNRLNALTSAELGKYPETDMFGYAFDDETKAFKITNVPYGLSLDTTTLANFKITSYRININNLTPVVTFYGYLSAVDIFNAGDGEASFFASFNRDPIGLNMSTTYMPADTVLHHDF